MHRAWAFASHQTGFQNDKELTHNEGKEKGNISIRIVFDNEYYGSPWPGWRASHCQTRVVWYRAWRPALPRPRPRRSDRTVPRDGPGEDHTSHVTWHLRKVTSHLTQGRAHVTWLPTEGHTSHITRVAAMCPCENGDTQQVKYPVLGCSFKYGDRRRIPGLIILP